MTQQNRHIKEHPGLPEEFQQMSSGSKIAWSKSKEEIWSEMQSKMEQPQPKQGRIISFPLRKLAIAAIFIVALGLPAFIMNYSKNINNLSDQALELFLPDQSKVVLYSQSEISYKPLLWKINRKLKLDGEAFFKVQKGKKFEVFSEKGRTMVLGTQFTVFARDGEYNVSCSSGKVKVMENAQNSEAILTAGQKAILQPDGHFKIVEIEKNQFESVEQVKNRNIEEELNQMLKPSPAQLQSGLKEEKPVKILEKQKVNKSSDAVKELEIQDNNITREEVRELQQSVKDRSAPKPKEHTNEKNTEAEPSVDQIKEQNKGNLTKIDKFRNSLTQDQIDILENQEMNREEKKKALLKSLSPEQQQLLEERNQERNQQNATQNSQSGTDNQAQEQQKTQLREQVRDGSGNETREQQRQQNRENIEKSKQGSGNSQQNGKGN